MNRRIINLVLFILRSNLVTLFVVSACPGRSGVIRVDDSMWPMLYSFWGNENWSTEIWLAPTGHEL